MIVPELVKAMYDLCFKRPHASEVGSLLNCEVIVNKVGTAYKIGAVRFANGKIELVVYNPTPMGPPPTEGIDTDACPIQIELPRLPATYSR